MNAMSQEPSQRVDLLARTTSRSLRSAWDCGSANSLVGGPCLETIMDYAQDGHERERKACHGSHPLKTSNWGGAGEGMKSAANTSDVYVLQVYVWIHKSI